MEPGVPFPLLAGVELLAALSALGVAVAACTRRVRSSWWPLLVAGALVLAAAEVATAVALGSGSDPALLWSRAVGFTLFGIGLWPAGRQAGGGVRVPWPWRRQWHGRPRGGGVVPGVSLAVVVPLGGSPSAAAAATAAGLGAALVALDHVRDGSRARRVPAVLLTAGLVLAAVACGLAPAAASSSGAALTLLVLRAGSALALVAMLAVLSRYSLLGKLMGAVALVALTVSVTAVTVVGTVMESSFEQVQREEAAAVADGRIRALDGYREQARRGAELVTLCPLERLSCEELLRLSDRGTAEPVAAFVGPDGAVQQLEGPPLGGDGLAELAEQPLVQQVLSADQSQDRSSVSALVHLDALGTRLALLGVAAAPSDAARATSRAGLWLVPLDPGLLQAGAGLTGGYDLSLVVDGRVVSSSLPPDQVDDLRETLLTWGVLEDPLEPEGATRTVIGSAPLVHLAPLPAVTGAPDAALAVTRPVGAVLAAERTALVRLVLVALGLTLVLAAAGALLGRQLVKPVRRLTAAAADVSRGNLETRSGVTAHDEIGALARAFDTMTASMAGLADGLRTAAAQEARLRTDLETVLASLSDGVVVLDDRGVVRRANAAAVALRAAVDDRDLLGRPLAEAFPLRGIDLSSRRGEGLLVRAQGGGLPVAAAAAPLAGGGGRVVVLRDLTREREVERMKTEFLSNVSHELRTPLTPIRGYADLLLRKPGLPPEQAVLYAAAILDACLRLTKVVDLLVDVAALEAGRVVPELRSVVAIDLLGSRVADWRTSAPERAGDLQLCVEPGLPSLLVDPFWLGRALDELIDNALKHTPPGTSVMLAAHARSEAYVALVVRDAGPGIPGEDRGRLLDSFEQADGSATRPVGGLGLGLAFVRRLSEDFGLQMRLESERGWGTEVTLVVPAAPTPGLVDGSVGVG